jgi:hypothetical protein
MAGFGGRIFRRSLRESVIACEFAHVLSNRARSGVPTYRPRTPLFSVQRAGEKCTTTCRVTGSTRYLTKPFPSLFGGRGTIIGSLLGSFVIGILDNGLVLLGVSASLQLVIRCDHSRTKTKAEEELLVLKLRGRKCRIRRRSGRPSAQKSAFKPVDSDQFQIGTRTVLVQISKKVGARTRAP